MDSKLSRWCDGFIEAGWIAAIIAVPLFFNIQSDRVFEPDKLTLLRSLAVLMSAAWLVKFVDQKGWRRLHSWRWGDENSVWKRPFLLPVFLIVIVYLLSTLFSVTPRVSWAGSYQRLQGTYTTLSYIVIFALAVGTMRTRAQVSRVVTAVIITSIPVSFYGLLQHFDLDPLPWGGDVTRRIAGHMGNAIFIAAYLIMAVPLTVGRIIDAFTKILGEEELAHADVIRASIYIFALMIQLIAIYWSQSRGPWIGLFVGLFAFVLIVLVALRNAAADEERFRWRDAAQSVGLALGGTAVLFVLFFFLLRALSGAVPSVAGSATSFVAFVAAVGVNILVIFVMIAARRGWRWLWSSWLLLSLLVAGWLAAFNFGDELDARLGETAVWGEATDTLVAWQELPAIGRLGRLLDSESRTGKVRVLIWTGALELIAPHEPLQFPDGSEDSFNFLRPLIGYGPESMYVAYNSFYPPELGTVEARNASPDRSHNETFDALVITGVLGFLAWQALYLSVFYYGFRWLGVVRSARDRNLLIGLWIGGALLMTLLITQTMGMPFLGVAIPFGSIIGLIIYLIYYALVARGTDAVVDTADPFHVDRLLMAALVAAVLAHYVEIHFGIAIAATRTYFFIFVALMFLLGYKLPRMETEEALPARRRRRRTSATPGPWGPVLFLGFMIGLALSILGFEYITYTLPPDKVIESAADLTAGDIFRQSLFVNASKNFVDSPFIFLMIALTWVLGVLAGLSELVKSGELAITEAETKLTDSRRRWASGMLVAFAVASLGFRLLTPATAATTASALLGRSLALIWSMVCLWAATRLYLRLPAGRLVAGGVSAAGLLLALPVLVAGGAVYGLVTAVISLFLLILLWDPSWQDHLVPAAVMAFFSLSLGLLYAYIQSSLLRASLLFQPEQQVSTLEELRVLEALQSTSFLTMFYVFIIGLLFLGSLFVAWRYLTRVKAPGTVLAYLSLLLIFGTAFWVVGRTNARVIQADVIYKRGKPFDDQATRTGEVQLWQVATAIYEKALELVPEEDFYYLFLGRGLLEQSTRTEDPAAKRALLQEAEARLLRAQEINPLNTDHTANLARLNTRWTQLAQGEAAQQERLQAAEAYYQKALTLSPQNSIIRNEYARLVYDLRRDCEGAIDIYQRAIDIDPFYSVSYFALADTYVACGADEKEAVRQEYYQEAIAVLEEGIALDDENVRSWVQAGQIYQELGRNESALAAYQEAQARNNGEIASWNIDYLMATLHLELGNEEMALAMAEKALAGAPPEVAGQIQQFINQIDPSTSETVLPAEAEALLAGERVPLSGERPLADVPPAEREGYFDSYPPRVIDIDASYEARIVTEKGDLRLQLFNEDAPLAVNNFVFLASQGFYDGTTFHRVLDDFVAQGGDPAGTGAGGPGYEFPDETGNGLTFDRGGLLAMANAGPGTNGSQFFITFGPTPALNGRYTIFGELVAGDEVLDALTRRDPEADPDFSGDLIERIEIIELDS